MSIRPCYRCIVIICLSVRTARNVRKPPGKRREQKVGYREEDTLSLSLSGAAAAYTYVMVLLKVCRYIVPAVRSINHPAADAVSPGPVRRRRRMLLLQSTLYLIRKTSTQTPEPRGAFMHDARACLYYHYTAIDIVIYFFLSLPRPVTFPLSLCVCVCV